MTATERTDVGSSARPKQSQLRKRYRAVPGSVPEARRAISRFVAAAGAAGEQLDSIRLVTSEALTNAVLYAYPNHDGKIQVCAGVAGGELWILIADDGCGIHAGPESSGLGLGLALVAELTDDFSITERSSGGTELQLRFTLASLAASDAHEHRPVASATRPASSRFSTTK